ncbi:MAG: hypothetical protein RL757_307 [Bacteroidota bacterium]|jgi:hypothetical protein
MTKQNYEKLQHFFRFCLTLTKPYDFFHFFNILITLFKMAKRIFLKKKNAKKLCYLV